MKHTDVVSAAPKHSPPWKKHLRSLGKVAVFAVFCGAVWLLYNEVSKYHIDEIRESMRQMPMSSIALSMVLMVFNYLVLVGYDALALRAINKPLSLARTALVSFVGCVTSYNFGALLGGSSVRYRFYSAWGFSVVDVVRLVIMLAITFWVGALGVAGAVFIIQPLPVPESLDIPMRDVRLLGVVLLALTVGYHILTLVAKHPIRVMGKEFALPPFRLAIMQTLVAGLDLVVAAACLYVLMPADLGLDFIQFLSVYLMAIVAVVLSHVPGGAGVFELVILSLSHTHSPQTVIAALICFRFIYYLLPLLFAAVLLGGHELHLRRHEAERILDEAGRWNDALAHTLMAYLAFAAGLILLFSSAIPVAVDSRAVLTATVPLAAMEAAHFLSGVAGVGLLLLSRGLQRRLASAWRLVTALVVLGIGCSVLKGLDWQEAILLALVLAALCATRRRFFRRTSLLRERFTVRWLVAVLLVVGCTLVVGLFVHGHLPYTHDLWWTFAADNDAARLLRAFGGIAVVLAVFLVRRLAFPLHGRLGEFTAARRERFRRIYRAAQRIRENALRRKKPGQASQPDQIDKPGTD